MENEETPIPEVAPTGQSAEGSKGITVAVTTESNYEDSSTKYDRIHARNNNRELRSYLWHVATYVFLHPLTSNVCCGVAGPSSPDELT